MNLLLCKIKNRSILTVSTYIFFSCSYTEEDSKMNLENFYTISKPNYNIKLTKEGRVFFENQIIPICSSNSSINLSSNKSTSRSTELISDNKKEIIRNFYITTLVLHKENNKIILDFLEKSSETEYSNLFSNILFYIANVDLSKSSNNINNSSLRKKNITESQDRDLINSQLPLNKLYEIFVLDFLKDRIYLEKTPKFGSPVNKTKKKSINISTKKYPQSDKKNYSLEKFKTPTKNNKLSIQKSKSKNNNLFIINSNSLQKFYNRANSNKSNLKKKDSSKSPITPIKTSKKDSILKKFETPTKNSKLIIQGYKSKNYGFSIINSRHLQKSDNKNDKNRKTIFSNKSTIELNKKNSSYRKNRFNNNSKDEINYINTKSSSEKKRLIDSKTSINKSLDVDISNYIKTDNNSRIKVFEEIEKKNKFTLETDLQELLDFDSKKNLIYLFKRKK